jgi:hypothetical protein
VRSASNALGSANRNFMVGRDSFDSVPQLGKRQNYMATFEA